MALTHEFPPPGRITALLGPTNTGKTHFAVERMLGHASGMIGLPLRLLAREVYDRVVSLRGRNAVALITGEEKILPASPAYFVCTVESMPVGREVAFLAVDEIQMAADPERGHVFTHRLLHARGTEETMFMGSDTIRPLLRRLVPRAEVVTRPRFSRLSFSGPKKLSRLPPRSAVVAFTADEVYAIAEFLRRQRGGAAVVMGALSPRTRNAQVAMFEAGEVDYLAATDAIGMGLNLSLNHVAFASLYKFDGLNVRALTAAEIGQVAGRAGRYMNDGTFGTTSDAGDLGGDMVAAVEGHHYPPLRRLMYRNSKLDTSSVPGLITSLRAPPPHGGLAPAREAEDLHALKALYQEDDIAQLARAPANVRLLWEVCGIPDFRKAAAGAHVRFLGQVYRHLAGPKRRLPTDWVAGHIARLDQTSGDIDTLAGRLSHVRTWTFISNRGAWLDDSGHWQGRARAVEDRLSDALHERLTQRFVDRRTAVLARKLRDKGDLLAVVEPDGEVMVEGHNVGRLQGFDFTPSSHAATLEGRTLRGAANRALRREINERARALAGAADGAIGLDASAQIVWGEQHIARLIAGPGALRPGVKLRHGELLNGRARDLVQQRVERWAVAHVDRILAPLVRTARADLVGASRGIAYHLEEGLGIVPRRHVADLVAALKPDERKRLRALGVRIGRAFVYVPAMLKPARAELGLILWGVHRGVDAPPLDAVGRVSLEPDPGRATGYYEAAGYAICGARAVRIDMLERLAAATAKLARQGSFTASPELLSLVGVSREEFPAVMKWLGFRTHGTAGTRETKPQGEIRYRLARSTKSGDRSAKTPPRREEKGGAKTPVAARRISGAGDPNSPFAPLRALVVEGDGTAKPGAKPKRQGTKRARRSRRRGPAAGRGQSTV